MIKVAGPTPTHRGINLAQVPLLFRQVAAAVASLKKGVIMTSNGRRKVRAKNIFLNISNLFRGGGGVSKQKNNTSEVPLLVQENNGVQRAELPKHWLVRMPERWEPSLIKALSNLRGRGYATLAS